MHEINREAWTVRESTIADAHDICELLFGLKQMYASTPAKTFEEFLIIHRAAVEKAIASDSYSAYVALNPTGDIVGFIGVTVRNVLRIPSPLGSIEEVFVRREYRNCGVATALWKMATMQLRRKGVCCVEVISSLAHPGQRPFAKSLGMEWYSSVHVIKI